MDKNQELEWAEAQKIGISADLVAAAEQQLQFLAAVDRRRSLYAGPVLDRAIYRYKTCWLPLLAKQAESPVLKGSLVVPLDCEWIWHCHRLNPVQYKIDCQEFYGRILDNQNVESSLLAKSSHEMEEMWTKLYPAEPFELDFDHSSSGIHANICSGVKETITYDLVSAVNRQSSFYHQVSRPSMHDKRFLEDAVARYRGFLHLIKRNQERSLKCFCVPTYDIDLMWHSHQLQPLSYCQDMLKLLGKVLGHDDTDSDRSKGKKLDVGYSETTEQWEDRYGLRYWRAGAMYRGSLPSPLTIASYPSDYKMKNEINSVKSNSFLNHHQKMVVEVLLEVVGVKNLPPSQKGDLYITFSKKQPDNFFSGTCSLDISSESGKKVAAGFECEPHGELVLTLMSSTSAKKPAKSIGKTSISLQHLMDPDSEMSVERWFELKPLSGNLDLKPVCLHVAVSFTVPVPAPLVFHMVKAHPIPMTTCLLPFNGKLQQIRSWTRVTDDSGNGIVSLQMRNSKTAEGNEDPVDPVSNRMVVGMTRLTTKPRTLAEYTENKWLLKDSNFSLHTDSKDGFRFELNGNRQIKLFLGKKLDYEPKNSKEQSQKDFITAVEFSAEFPYGKAVALLDVKSGLVKVNVQCFALPAIVLAFIISNTLKKEGHNGLEEIANTAAKTDMSSALATAMTVNETGNAVDTVKKHGNAVSTGGCGAGCGGGCGGCGTLTTEGSGGCGAGCGGGCGEMNGERSGGCGAGCGGGYGGFGMAVKSSGCGGGCGGSGIAVKSSGCGSGCGGGCGGSGMAVKSSGCGSGCGGGCGGSGMAVKSSGCGSGCGGGCGGAATATGGHQVPPVGA